MSSLMRSINRISRCGILYRSEKFSPHGINGYQNVYLQNICKNPGISQDQLAKKILVNKSNVARQVAVLEKNGYLIRTVSEKDKRQFELYPTEKALSLYPVIHNVLKCWNEKLLEDLPPEEREYLSDKLEKIMEKAVSLVSQNVMESEEFF